MKSRIVKTSLWYDNDFSNLSKDGKLLFLYLLTCPFIDLTGIFEFSRSHTLLETGLSESELKSALSELEKTKKVFLYKEWVYVPKTDKHCKYSLGRFTGMGFEREMSEIPKDILEYFNNRYPYYKTPVRSLSDHKKIENINNKTEHINKKAENSENINPDDIPF